MVTGLHWAFLFLKKTVRWGPTEEEEEGRLTVVSVVSKPRLEGKGDSGFTHLCIFSGKLNPG